MTPLTLYKSLADETRMLCLLLLQTEGELCVCELMEALEEAQPKVSRHLAQLRKAELLVDRRQGQWVFYRINPMLPDWAKTVLAISAENNPAVINAAQKRLKAMHSRPEKTACC